MSEIVGIFQSDILIRSAVAEALARIQADPSLIDECFQSLMKDPLTCKDYGAKEIEQAKKWITSTNVPVFMSWRVDELKWPCVTISVQESTETENTLGDAHYVTTEDTEAEWPPIAGPFSPVAYAGSSGMMVLNPDDLNQVSLAAGMFILDRDGREHEIADVLDESTVSIAPGTVADFQGSYLKGAKPRLVTSIGSSNARETYQIGVHVQGESFYLMWLHSVLMYAMLKYREDLFEGRGFERSSLASSEFQRNENFGNELVYSRAITVNGFARQVWSKKVSDQIDSTDTTIVVRTTDSDAALPVPDDVGLGVEDDGTVVPV